jgi:hypothetical protein
MKLIKKKIKTLQRQCKTSKPHVKEDFLKFEGDYLKCFCSLLSLHTILHDLITLHDPNYLQADIAAGRLPSDLLDCVDLGDCDDAGEENQDDATENIASASSAISHVEKDTQEVAPDERKSVKETSEDLSLQIPSAENCSTRSIPSNAESSVQGQSVTMPKANRAPVKTVAKKVLPASRAPSQSGARNVTIQPAASPSTTSRNNTQDLDLENKIKKEMHELVPGLGTKPHKMRKFYLDNGFGCPEFRGNGEMLFTHFRYPTITIGLSAHSPLTSYVRQQIINVFTKIGVEDAKAARGEVKEN